MARAYPLPSFQTGFARRRSEARYPNLWRDVQLAVAPCLGPTGTLMYDSGPYRLDGTLTNMQPATDWVIHGGQWTVDFDGADDDVVFGSPLNWGTEDRSLSFWFYSTNLTDLADWLSNRVLGASGTQPGFYIGKGGNAASGLMQFFAEASDSTYTRQDYTSFFGLNTWYHVVGTFCNVTGAMNLYRDAVLISPSSTAGSSLAGKTITSTGNFQIGNRPGATNRSPNGGFDDVRIFRRVLTMAEIKLLSRYRGIAWELADGPAVGSVQVGSPWYYNLQQQLLAG